MRPKAIGVLKANVRSAAHSLCNVLRILHYVGNSE
uniref:Uncharacterized protein n=1 Tax=Anguilla anguilla TaxID=7936 RepID=A0A0E9QCE4_ANGAN